MTLEACFQRSFARAVLYLLMFAIDALKMALGLSQIAGNEGTQDSRAAYILYGTDGNLK
jgi:hypothetical protein